MEGNKMKLCINKNGSCIREIREYNEKKITDINKELEKILGYTVDKEILKEVALKRLFQGYNLFEIVDILQYYNLIDSDDVINHLFKGGK